MHCLWTTAPVQTTPRGQLGQVVIAFAKKVGGVGRPEGVPASAVASEPTSRPIGRMQVYPFEDRVLLA